MKIILQGRPGIGKSTILKKIYTLLESKNAKGCIVEEERENGNRVGFRIKYLPEGNSTKLASVNEKLSDVYLSKYSINIGAIENEMIPYMLNMKSESPHGVFIFDEIGRMQQKSEKFIQAVDHIMSISKPVIATIVYDDEIWARKYKNNIENFVITVTEFNRDYIADLIKTMLDYYEKYKAFPQNLKNELIHISTT
ncbi:MAG: nucleoside-triphosphatase [Holosporales bacterium]|jgi:nucleoside-triphosphatase|nr:nucleoside-triphosphatase [Holosporales bacterium]